MEVEEEKKEIPSEVKEEEEVTDPASTKEGEQKKKKKKKKKKKGGAAKTDPALSKNMAQDNSKFWLIGSWTEWEGTQTWPEPTIPIIDQFPDLKFPEGEICEYKDDNRSRITSEEMRLKDKLIEENVRDLRQAAEVHRNVWKYAQSFIQPGMKLMDITNKLEAKLWELIKADGLNAG